MQNPDLIVVGLGPGDPGLVTVAGAQALREADVVFLPRRRSEQQSVALRICESYLDAGRQRVVALPLVMERDHPDAPAAWDAAAATIAEHLPPGTRGVYALLGDPMIYGSFAPIHGRLQSLRPALAIKFLPGVTSFSAAAAAIGEPLVSEGERLAIVPGLYDHDAAELAETLAEFDAVAVLKAGRSLPAIARVLEESAEPRDLWLAERVGMDGERITRGREAVAAGPEGRPEGAGAPASYFALALIKRRPNAVSQRGGKVVFVGSGPGSPDLITVRGRRAIKAADAILYADSLVMEAVTRWARPDAQVVPTSGMHLDDILALMREVVAAGGIVARVHSGDPALYGATHEQMRALDADDVPYEVVPGVTVAFAAAARLQAELTVPELTQTIILTRVSGRASPVPEAESLKSLAAHRASLAIYLAATKAHQVQADLLEGGYPPETPVAIGYRVDWPDEQIVRCRLDGLAEQIRARGFTRQTLILVSPALDAPAALHSRLYDAEYVHRFRNRRTPGSPPMGVAPAPVAGRGSRSAPVAPAVVAVTRAGSALALQLAAQLGGAAYVPERFAQPSTGGDQDAAVRTYAGSVVDLVAAQWNRHGAFVLVMATGIAVRAIGGMAADKRHDPAVVVCDEAGRSAISLIGGHRGGANRLAQAVAAHTGGRAVITTASEVADLPALDLLGEDLGWRIAPGSALTRAMAALVNGDRLALYDPRNLMEAALPATVERVDDPAALLDERWAAILVVSEAAADRRWLERGVVYHPPLVAAGIGCRRGASPEAIEAALREACARAGIAFEAVGALATVSLKADEPGLLAVSERHGLPLRVFSADEVRAVDRAAIVSPSAATERFDLPGVAEPCALLAAGAFGAAERLLLPKQAFAEVTVALASEEVRHG